MTTNYHVLRSGILARMAGLDAEGVSSGTRWHFWPNGFAREFIGIMSMYPAVHGFVIMAALAAARLW